MTDELDKISKIVISRAWKGRLKLSIRRETKIKLKERKNIKF